MNTTGIHTVVIDPGHGGSDPGAVGPNGITEAAIVLSVSLRVKDLLDQYDRINCLLTREDDSYLTLSERPALANANSASSFVSIHCNAAENTSARGWEVFTTRGQNVSDKLACKIGCMYGNMNPELTQRSDWSDRDLDKEANHAVTRGTNCPSCLFELEFISNPDAEALLQLEAYQEKAARSIAYGILEFHKIDIAEPVARKTKNLSTIERLERIEQKLGLN